MARLVRRRPLLQRILARLNPLDFLLWLSEELDTSDWEQWEQKWAVPAGCVLNVVFLVARVNSRTSSGYGSSIGSDGALSPLSDDIFLDDSSSAGASYGVIAWLASITAQLLAVISCLNALYTFKRKRQYRLFETGLDDAPATPSAHRVSVQATPMLTTPLKALSETFRAQSIEPLASAAAASRATATGSAARDVWELDVWDPHPLSIRMFCYFSPGHVLVYWLLLPASRSDSRPSVTVLMSLVMALILSAQLSLFSASYMQQAKDMRIVHREVMHEYDTKYVRPRTTRPIMRDAATQYAEEMSHRHSSDERHNTVEVFTPDFIRRQKFRVNPNPDYVRHVDPEGVLAANDWQVPRPAAITTPLRKATPRPRSTTTTPFRGDPFTPSRPPAINGSNSSLRKSTFRTPGATGVSTAMTGDGGSLGAYTHANSPVKKSTTPFQRRFPAPTRAGPAQTSARGTPLKPRATSDSPSMPSVRNS